MVLGEDASEQFLSEMFNPAAYPAAYPAAAFRTFWLCAARESNAKRADEHLELDDLPRATKVLARMPFELLKPS